MHRMLKAATPWQLAFSVILLLLLASCENPGSVGAGFVDESEIQTDTLLLADVTVTTVDPYLGKLTYSPVGRFEDPLFGEMESFAFLKPGIRTDFDGNQFLTADFNLRLQMDTTLIYGDTTLTGNYEVYRVNNLWRGSTFRKSGTVNYDAQLIGQFSDTDADTLGFIDVSLDATWASDYLRYYNIPDDSTRYARYRDEMFGLAIVPSAGNENIRHFRFRNSSFRLNAADTTLLYSIIDWGYDLERNLSPNASPSETQLQTTFENVIRLNLNQLVDTLRNTNLVRAELVVAEDTTALQTSLQPGQVRTTANGITVTYDDYQDLAYEMAFASGGLNGFITDGYYRFNLTPLINGRLYGNQELDELYIHPVSNGGLLGHTVIYNNLVADRTLAPQVVIYSLVK